MIRRVRVEVDTERGERGAVAHARRSEPFAMPAHRHDLREEARRYDASQRHDAGRRGVIDHRGDEAVARRETPRPAQTAWQTEPGDFDDAHAGRRAVRTKVGKQGIENMRPFGGQKPH